MFKFFKLKEHTPRWIILIIDLLVSVASMVFAFLLRFNFDLDVPYFGLLDTALIIVIVVRLSLFLITRSFAGIIRYTGTRDAVRIIVVITISNALYILINLISLYFFTESHIIPLSVILIDYFISIFLLTAFRLMVKTIYVEANNLFKEIKHIIILGINENAIITKSVLTRDSEIKYKVDAFIDPYNIGKKKQIDGIKFYKLSEIKNIINKYNISELIIADKTIPADVKQEVIDICLEFDVNVLTLPDVADWINGELSFKQIRKINIEDLLERAPIQLDRKLIKKDVLNKVILVTGAAGSIGREIVIQLTKYKPKQILIFDQAESPLYDIELELKEKFNFTDYEIIIGDITNALRVKKLYETFKPSTVYHAAAYKHVPMMENNPSEAVRTNILGTKIIADEAVANGVKKFVMISTDKAVNPTNVMGATKRIAEVYIQSLQNESETSFITTRFGNVLGSNGSVIPRFRQQIEDGGPVTVTHPEITRFFMTIPEACQLVLQAGAIGQNGEILIFDMGRSVKIVDLAKKMIKLSGFKLGTDISLKFTGLRPGEKLYEELLADKEMTIPTNHKKILIAKTRKYDHKEIVPKIEKMISALESQDNFEIVRLMKEILPEFISKNSIYETLDE